jgi:putative transposase
MRRRRELIEGARYHVTARANRKEMILESDSVKELFLETITRAKRRYIFQVENFCLMGNHFHFILKPGPGQNLSVIMRWILSVFAMAYNRARGLTGHVWGDRFFSRVICNLRVLLQVFEYIDDNPVLAGKVENKLDWRWGGLWHHRMGCHGIVGDLPGWLWLLLPAHRRLTRW